MAADSIDKVMLNKSDSPINWRTIQRYSLYICVAAVFTVLSISLFMLIDSAKAALLLLAIGSWYAVRFAIVELSRSREFFASQARRSSTRAYSDSSHKRERFLVSVAVGMPMATIGCIVSYAEPSFTETVAIVGIIFVSLYTVDWLFKLCNGLRSTKAILTDKTRKQSERMVHKEQSNDVFRLTPQNNLKWKVSQLQNLARDGVISQAAFERARDDLWVKYVIEHKG